MPLLLGPILGFRGCDGGVWRISVLVAAEGVTAPKISVAKPGKLGALPKTPLKSMPYTGQNAALWRFDIQTRQGKSAQSVSYQVGDVQAAFHVPAKDAAPRMAYASCNGFSSMKLLKNTKDANALWKHLRARHDETPYDLMLLGGDQVYADSMWETLPELQAWAALPLQARIAKKSTATLTAEIDRFYRELYIKRWSQPAPAAMFARVPSIMMWDDHDIIDGWGSYDKALQACDVYQTLFRAAREYFSLYQQHADPAQPASRHPLTLPGQAHFTLGCRVGPVAIVALDMRSERSGDQVLSLESWRAIYDWLDALPAHDIHGPRGNTNRIDHLWLMSSIPVVHPDFALLEQALGLFPGSQELEDDLRDHWTSVPHRQERLRLIHRLLDFSAQKKCRVTLLSGDVHVGAVGVVRSVRGGDPGTGTRVLNQLTSSGIVHPAPPGMALFFLENFVGKSMSDDRGVESEMVVLPGTRYHYIGARNWLALEPTPDNRYWANWHVDGESHPYTKVIHPVDFKQDSPA